MFNGERKAYNIAQVILGAIISIVPFITYLKVINLSGVDNKYWKGGGTSYDFFSYYKVVWLIILTSLLIVLFVYNVYRKKLEIEKTKIYIPLVIYGLLIITSAILSEYKNTALLGFVERWEGMFVILVYLMLFFISINLFNTQKNYKRVISIFIISAVVMATIGIFQYIGHDLLKTEVMKKLMLPSKYHNLVNNITFQFDKGIIYTTLYHYNYVGSYMAMLFPMTLVLTLFSNNKIKRIILSLITLLMFVNLIASNSRAGVVGGILATLILIIILRKKLLKHWKIGLSIVGSVIAIILIFNNYTNGMLSNRVLSLFIDAKNLITSNSQSKELKDVVVIGNSLSVIYPEETLTITLNNSNIEFIDKNSKKLQLIEVNEGFKINEERYKDYLIEINQLHTTNGSYYVIGINKSNFKMGIVPINNTFKFLNKDGQLVDINSVPFYGFEGKEKLGSARAYIWSRSIPLLKNTIFKGYGPDTFAMYFPQDDYIGKYKAYGTFDMLVDKPHNMYLQTALSSGIFSLFAMLVIFGMYIIKSFKIYFNHEINSFYSILGLAIFVAIIGYLGAGLFNDSVVSVAPIFWVLLGMGVSINLKLSNKETSEEI